MIIMQVDLEPGYRKADINSIPTISNETIFSFITKVARILPAEEKYLRLNSFKIK